MSVDKMCVYSINILYYADIYNINIFIFFTQNFREIHSKQESKMNNRFKEQDEMNWTDTS